MKRKIYISTFSDNCVNGAKEYNLGLEINQTCISESLDFGNRLKLTEEITNILAETNCKNILFHGPFTEICPAAIDPRMGEAGMSRLEEAYEVVQFFGGTKMVVHTGWLPFIYFKSWQIEKSAVFWQKFMEDKPKDFILCIENVLEDEPYMLKNMMEKVSDSRIKICLDVGHANAMTTSENSVYKWISVLGPCISHFHLHNNDGTGDTHSSFQEGSLDMNKIFEYIKAYCSDDVTFTIESRDCMPCIEWLNSNGYI